jgi:hypothetical protein
MIDRQSRIDLARAATAILRAGNYSAGGEVKDARYKRRKRAERRIEKRRSHEKEAMLLGTFGAASPVRSVK